MTTIEKRHIRKHKLPLWFFEELEKLGKAKKMTGLDVDNGCTSTVTAYKWDGGYYVVEEKTGG